MSILAEIIRKKLLPWSLQNGHERFVVTHSRMRQSEMPEGVVLAPRPIKGKRVIVRGRRIYKNRHNVTACWPESGLIEVQKYKLTCVLDGAINYPVGKYSLQCGPGHFLFFPPGLPNSDGSVSHLDTSKSTFCKTISFQLHPGAVQYWISRREINLWQNIENAIIRAPRLVALFHALMEEIYETEEPLPIAKGALLTAFFSMLKREIDNDHVILTINQEFDTPASEQITDFEGSDFRAGLERYIKANIQKHISIDAAARAMYLSRSQFTRTMRRELGMSFNEYFNRYRLQQAKVLLSESEWTVTFIAELLGFKSVNYFRAFFHKHTQNNPNEFRHKNIPEK